MSEVGTQDEKRAVLLCNGAPVALLEATGAPSLRSDRNIVREVKKWYIGHGMSDVGKNGF